MPPLMMRPQPERLRDDPQDRTLTLERFAEVLPAAAVGILMVAFVAILLQLHATRRQLDDLRQDVRHLTTLAHKVAQP